jgi:thiamine biosynthesis lipoprotein
MTSDMHRRDFLRPRHLALSAGQVLGALHEFNQAPAAAEEGVLLRLSRRAMATTFAVLLPFDTPHPTLLGAAVFGLLDELEDQLTVYRDTSEVCGLNRLAASRAVPVEPRLFDLLSRSARISEETEGAFDVTAGALIKAWGFFRGPRRVPAEGERQRAVTCVGMQHVALAPESRSVRFLRPGLELNLGSIGKGYALDRVAEMLRSQWHLRSGLLHGGFSSVHAIGSPPDDPAGWQVGIRHPWDAERRLAVVRLRNRALGNSAATYQHLEHEGRMLGHVLDPRTGWPAAGIASASVIAATAADADALSTAFYVGGQDLARRYCAAHPEVGALLLPEGDAAEPVVLNLTPDDVTLEIPAETDG